VAEPSSTPPPTSVKRRERVVMPRRLKWHHHLSAFLIFASIRLLSWTWRCRLVDAQGVLVEPPGPMIFCMWHNRLALAATIWEKFGRHKVRSAGLVALISASHDGGVLARTMRYFKVEAVRGSSSRRGAQALLELTTWTERAHSIAITPDGPRGPRYVVQDGILALAQVSGLPILPVSAVVRWKFCLKSWDRFQVPLPFTRCEIRVGRPVKVPREATDEERLALKAQLQERMQQLTED
jgi:lysophospholipid acyltransferase (LPLAT)-like uncharacterized protein